MKTEYLKKGDEKSGLFLLILSFEYIIMKIYGYIFSNR